MKIYLIIGLLLLTLTLVSASDNSFGFGDAVFNTIERANSTNSTWNQTYQIVNTTQITDIQNGVNGINQSLNQHIQETNKTLGVIQNQVNVINSTVTQINKTVTEIYQTPNPESTSAGLIFIFGILILGAVGFLIFLVIRKKSTNLYRCKGCNKLFLVEDKPAHETPDKHEVKGGKDGIPKDEKETHTQSSSRGASV